MSAKGTKSAGPAESMVTLDVSLLGRDYKVACKPGEQSELKDAVAFLELRMRARLGNDDGVAASTREVEPDEVDFLPGVVLEVPEDVY